MIDLSNAVQWLEGIFKDLQLVWTSPEILPWSTSIALLLIFSIIVRIMRRRRQVAAIEWRRTLAARARA
jgi:membrane glycosyltransferase